MPIAKKCDIDEVVAKQVEVVKLSGLGGCRSWWSRTRSGSPTSLLVDGDPAPTPPVRESAIQWQTNPLLAQSTHSIEVGFKVTCSPERFDMGSDLATRW